MCLGVVGSSAYLGIGFRVQGAWMKVLVLVRAPPSRRPSRAYSEGT